MANLIELVARWRDEGAQAGIQKTSQHIAALTNAIGIVGGVGAIASVNVLARGLGVLARAPIDAANNFAQLTDRIRIGKDVTAEAQHQYAILFETVGQKGVDSFNALAAAQKRSNDESIRFSAKMAADNAELARILTEAKIAIMGGKVYNYGVTDLANAARAAGPDTEQGRFGLVQLNERQREGIARSVQKEAEAAIKIAEARDREAAAFQRMIRAATPESTLYQGGIRKPGPVGVVRPDAALPEKALRDFADVTSQMQQIGIAAGQAIISSIDTTIVNFNNKMQTIGSALRAFFSNVVNAIMGTIAKIGLSFLGKFLLSFAIPGGFLAGIGTGLGGAVPVRAGRPRAEGNTYVFQGLNTREMYQAIALRDGSIARANDLVRMRAEVA